MRAAIPLLWPRTCALADRLPNVSTTFLKLS